MKTLKLILVVLIVTAINLSSSARSQNQTKGGQSAIKTESIKVAGNCGMCKTRIEKAAKEVGAATADWDSKTDMLTVTYDPSKTNTDALSKKMAEVGHDTEKYKAADEVYKNLPGCCHYDRLK